MSASHKPSKIRFKFRTVLTKIEQELSKKKLQEIAFVYEMGEHLEKENKINGLTLFNDIISEGKLDHSDGELIADLVEILSNLQRKNLARLLIEYCSKWNICYEASPDQQVRSKTSTTVSSDTATATDPTEGRAPMSIEQVQDLANPD